MWRQDVRGQGWGRREGAEREEELVETQIGGWSEEREAAACRITAEAALRARVNGDRVLQWL